QPAALLDQVVDLPAQRVLLVDGVDLRLIVGQVRDVGGQLVELRLLVRDLAVEFLLLGRRVGRAGRGRRVSRWNGKAFARLAQEPWALPVAAGCEASASKSSRLARREEKKL